jgi:hypothetical protein
MPVLSAVSARLSRRANRDEPGGRGLIGLARPVSGAVDRCAAAQGSAGRVAKRLLEPQPNLPCRIFGQEGVVLAMLDRMQKTLRRLGLLKRVICGRRWASCKVKFTTDLSQNVKTEMPV